MVHIVKIYFENAQKEQEIRRLTVNSDVVSNFKLLLLKVQSVFQLPDSDASSLEIKWKDPENDFILMSSNDELAQALANAEEGLLRLYVSFKKDKSESTSIPKCSSSGTIHPYVMCDGCEKKIAGVRYKCLQCRNYDLCASCEAADKHPSHDMIKFVKPTYIPREWVFVGARKLWRSMFNRCPSSYFTGVDNETEEVLNAKFCSEALNADSQAKDNTVPKSVPTGNGPSSSTSQQPKEKSSADHPGAQQNPFTDFANLPRVFMDCFQTEFPGAPDLIHNGLSQVLKAVQGTIEVVDHHVNNLEAKKSQEGKKDANKTGSPTANTPAETTKSPIVEKPIPCPYMEAEVIFHPEAEPMFPKEAAANNNVDSAQMQTDKDKSSADADASEIIIDIDGDKPSANAVAKESEIIIDLENERSSSVVGESIPCADGWTLLEGEDTNNNMECNEATAAPATEAVVAYPDLMEVEANQVPVHPITRDDYVQTSDPMIISAVTTMRAMGFTNEGGWLERLLISKHGNINDALEALYPSIQQH